MNVIDGDARAAIALVFVAAFNGYTGDSIAHFLTNPSDQTVLLYLAQPYSSNFTSPPDPTANASVFDNNFDAGENHALLGYFMAYE